MIATTCTLVQPSLQPVDPKCHSITCLRHLTFGFSLTHPFNGVERPTFPTGLTFESSFHQPANGTTWRTSLHQLTFGDTFIRPIDGLASLMSLQCLRFGYGSTQPVDEVTWGWVFDSCDSETASTSRSTALTSLANLKFWESSDKSTAVNQLSHGQGGCVL